MDAFLRIDINLAAMVMLAIVSLIACKKLDRKDQLSRVFLITCYIIILQLFFESATCIITKKP